MTAPDPAGLSEGAGADVRLTEAEYRRCQDAARRDTANSAVHLFSEFERIVTARVTAAVASQRAELDEARAQVAAHVVHVTAEPIAEDVVWCDECEEWVASGAPEPPVAAQPERDCVHCGTESALVTCPIHGSTS